MRSSVRVFLAAASVLVVFLLQSAAGASVIRVKWDSPADGPGNDWDDAYHTVTAAIAVSVAGDEIWVAGDAAHPYVENIRLKGGVGLYGGFTGGETTRDQRDWTTNETILDGGGSGTVVFAPAGATATTVLDGFSIRNGSVGIYCYVSSPTITNNTISGNGETGIYCDSSSPTITNNTISGNGETGIDCSSRSSPTITNNTISGNGETGIDCSPRSSPTITNNTISGNGVDGIRCYDSSPSITNNTIAGNAGCGIYCLLSSPSITNNTIAGSGRYGIWCSSSSPSITNNIVAFNGTGIDNSMGAPVLGSNCVFNPDGTNYSGLAAGASDITADPKFQSAAYGKLHIQPGSPCVDAGLDSAVGPGWRDMDGQARIQGSHVDIGADESDGTVWPEYVPVIVRVSPGGVDDAAHDGSSWALAKRTVQAGIEAASAARGEVWVAAGVYNEMITLPAYVYLYGGFAGGESARDERDWGVNTTVLDGGGSDVVTATGGCNVSAIDGFTIRNGRYYIYCYLSSPSIRNNTITGDGDYGDCGIYCEWYSSPMIANNTISGNDWAGIHCYYYSSPTITNNTISGNRTAGILIYDSTSSPTITNNIVAFSFRGIYKYSTGGAPVLGSNCVFNPDGVNYSGLSAGSGDISEDPLFADRAAGNLRLLRRSPCIDAGDDAGVPPWLIVDKDGNPRISGSHVDMGAFEFAGDLPPCDLAVTSVAIPPGGVPGQACSISWVVTNNGPNAAIGGWYDGVYLSTDATWDLEDTLVARIPHTGPVAMGTTYDGACNVPLPGVLPGTYYVIVRADARDELAETDEANNTRVSGTGGGQETLTSDMPELTLGQPTNGQLPQKGSRYYKVLLEKGKDLKISLDAACGDCANELYASFGKVPDRTTYDFAYSKPFQPGQTIRVPGTQVGWYYILIYGDNVPSGSESYTVLAEELALRIDSISPSRGGNVGRLSIRIEGAGFAEGCECQLTQDGAVVVSSFASVPLDTTAVLAAFDLRGVPAGTYSLAVRNPDDTLGLRPSSFAVIDGGGSQLRISIEGSSVLRRGSPAKFTVTLANEGENDLEAAILALTQPTEDIVATRQTAVLVGNTKSGVASMAVPGTALPLTWGPIPPGGALSLPFPVATDVTGCYPVGASAIPLVIPGDDGGDNDCEALRRYIDALDSTRSALEGLAAFLVSQIDTKTKEYLEKCPLGSLLSVAYCERLAKEIRELEYRNSYNDQVLESVRIALQGACYAYALSGCPSPPPSGCADTAPSSAVGAPGATANAEYCVANPVDPNDKGQPVGYGLEHFVSDAQSSFYQVNFENIGTAAATRVDITDTLDTDLDLATLELREIVFSGVKVEVPAGRTHYDTRLQLGPEFNNILADVSVDVDVPTRQIKWTIRAIDPATGEQPVSWDVGLLAPCASPPCDPAGTDAHKRQGYVSYVIKPMGDTPTGALITNSASIVFDELETITTNTVSNTIDSGAPTSAVLALPAATGGPDFAVSWTAMDDAGGSGVASVDVYASDNGGAYALWLAGQTGSSATFTGELNHTYSFYSVARDNVGNAEEPPAEPDATTTVTVLPPSAPVPADGATAVSLRPALSWSPGDGAETHDLYLWETSAARPPTPTASSIGDSFQVTRALGWLAGYNWQVVARNGEASAAGPVWAFSTGEAPPDGGLPGARALADGAQVELSGVVVTANFGSFFYVENLDRSCGIRIAGASPPAGKRIGVIGTIQTTGEGERYIQASGVSVRGDGSIWPLNIGSQTLGGGPIAYDPATGAGQRGLEAVPYNADGVATSGPAPMTGLNNVGLLVTLTGKVVRVHGGEFYLVDASLLGDGTARGLRVRMPAGSSPPPAESFVSVTGISSLYAEDGHVYRLLLAAGTDAVNRHTGGLLAAKQTPDGTSIMITDLVVSGHFPGFFYAQDKDRSGGIRVVSGSAFPAVGTKITLIGTLGTTDQGERYIQALQIDATGSGTAAPLFLSCRALGGEDFLLDAPGLGQRGVKQGVGLNNIGLLVRLSGRVTSADAQGGFFTLWDSTSWNWASGLMDSNGSPGVRVLSGSAPLPAVGEWLTVTGISSCYKAGEVLFPLVRVKEAGDILRL